MPHLLAGVHIQLHCKQDARVVVQLRFRHFGHSLQYVAQLALNHSSR